MKATTSMAQANTGILCSAMPGARVLRMETISSTAAETAETSASVMPISQKSGPLPGEKAGPVSGVYMNQPPSGAASNSRLE